MYLLSPIMLVFSVFCFLCIVANIPDAGETQNKKYQKNYFLMSGIVLLFDF